MTQMLAYNGRDRSPPEPSDAMREFTAILQHVSAPCALADRDGIYVWANDAFVETFGDLRGRSIMTMITRESRDEVARQFARKLEGEQATEYEVDTMLANGRRVRTEVSSVRINSSFFGAAVFGITIPRAPATPPHQRTHLTPRQSEILELLADGASTDQMAAELHLSVHTVRNFVRQVLKVLRAHSRLEAVVKARREGLVSD
jgi:PAS domain S-box-containing protein